MFTGFARVTMIDQAAIRMIAQHPLIDREQADTVEQAYGISDITLFPHDSGRMASRLTEIVPCTWSPLRQPAPKRGKLARITSAATGT